MVILAMESRWATGEQSPGGYYPNVRKNGKGALVVPESSTREIISFGDEEPDPAEYAGGKASPSRTPCCSHLRPFKLFFSVIRVSYFLS